MPVIASQPIDVVVVAVLLCICMFVPGSLQQKGQQISPCIWQHTNGSVINLGSIGFTNGTARWTDKATVDTDSDPNLYSVNPCHGFTQTSDCQDVAVCKTSGLATFNIGDVADANMFYSSQDNTVVLEYSHTDTTTQTKGVSQLVTICTEAGTDTQLTAYGASGSEQKVVTYRFLLLSPCACYDGCPNGTGPTLGPVPSPTVSIRPIVKPTVTLRPIVTPTGSSPPKSQISAGGVICIIFVCCVGGYFLIGGAYMFFCAGARGKEIIPNVDFWMSLPVLIFEGFAFLCSCCTVQPSASPPLTSPGTSTTDYDKI